jgi:hypothetical protein
MDFLSCVTDPLKPTRVDSFREPYRAPAIVFAWCKAGVVGTRSFEAIAMGNQEVGRPYIDSHSPCFA